MAWVVLTASLCVGALLVTAISFEDAQAPAGAPLAQALDWQAARGLGQPWRLWTCAWVHWSAAHLAVNVAGALVVAFTGWRARLPAAAALAWLLAWPGTQVAMALVDRDALAAAMPHYGGLSGVLHAGAVVLGLSLAWPAPRARSPARGTPSRTDTGFAATRTSAIDPSRITEGPWAMTGLDEAHAHTGLPILTLDQPPASVSPTPPTSLRDRWIGVAIVGGTLAKVATEAPWHLAPRPSAWLGMSVAPLAHACGVAAGVLAWGLVRGLAPGVAAIRRR